MTPAPDLPIRRCAECQRRTAARTGACPACGSNRFVEEQLPAEAVVLAATELSAPSSGWTAPHRIALVEVAGDVRLLAVVVGELPATGSRVEIRALGEGFEAHRAR